MKQRTPSSAAEEEAPMKECEPTHGEIAIVAYKFWEEEGRPHGRDVIHWLRAFAHVALDIKHTSQAKSRKQRGKN